MSGAKGRITFSCSSPGRGMGRLCWRMCQKVARNFLVAWEDTKTQVRGWVDWGLPRRREALSLGFRASDMGSALRLLSSFHHLPAKDQTEKGEGQATQAGASAAGDQVWDGPGGQSFLHGNGC